MKQVKKVLFIIPSFRIGGTMTSLKNLLPLINKPEYDLYVYPITNEGSNREDIARFVTIIGSATGRRGSVDSLKRFFLKVLTFIVKQIKRTLVYLGIDISPFIFRASAERLIGFDIVIAFQEGHPALFASFIKAPMKIVWLHSMFSAYLNSRKSKEKEIQLYTSFDKIVCVSKTAAKDLRECCCLFNKDKIHVIYNAINASTIRELAKTNVSLGPGFNCVSVGRIDRVKRFSVIPELASKLKQDGLHFDWWIVGGVADKKEYKRLINGIKKFGCVDCIHLVGQKDNPYPYIENSDVLVCLSSSETYNYTIAEAKVLRVPVITTDYPSAYEFVTDGFNGLIVPIEEIPSRIEAFYYNREYYTIIKKNIEEEHDLSASIVDGFDDLTN